MPRGFVWGTYVDDLGNAWAVRVDADYADQPERGWQLADVQVVPQLPRGWKPRYVVGLDPGGAARHAICATVTCDLWTGVATAFVFEGSDQVDYVAEVISRTQERRLPSGFAQTP